MSHYAALPKAIALAVPITLGAWTVQAADIVETVEEVGWFNGFLHLLEAAGMVEMGRDTHCRVAGTITGGAHRGAHTRGHSLEVELAHAGTVD